MLEAILWFMLVVAVCGLCAISYRVGYRRGRDSVILRPLEPEELLVGNYVVLSVKKSGNPDEEVLTLSGCGMNGVAVRVTAGQFKEGMKYHVFAHNGGGIWPKGK